MSKGLQEDVIESNARASNVEGSTDLEQGQSLGGKAVYLSLSRCHSEI